MSLQPKYRLFWFRFFLLFLLSCLFLELPAQAQETRSGTIDNKRLKRLVYGGAIGYTSTWVGLYALWYADQPRTRFHFFNDSRQWMLMDKAGHAYSAFHLSRAASSSLQWVGLPLQKANLYGSLSGWLMMVPIEIMDGFAKDYGASWADFAANSAGSLLYGSQILLWKEVRIKPKFSFKPSTFAPDRPNVLGHNFATQLLKDYNGQSYWLSFDIAKFLPPGKVFPSWLNLGVGYGIEGMVYARPEASKLAGYNPYRQFFIGPDIDLSSIKTKNSLIKALLFVLDGVRIPAPALEFSKNRIQLHPVFF